MQHSQSFELFILCAGEQDIPGLTDKTIPRRLGPKRASKIRKLFNLSKDDDVRQYVVRRPLPEKEGKAYSILRIFICFVSFKDICLLKMLFRVWGQMKLAN